MSLKNPVIAALDLDDAQQAVTLAKRIGPYVGALKVGPRLAIRYGPQLIQELADVAPVFLDNKYFDIPSTMEGAVRASFDAGASLVTIHAMAGAPAIEKLAALEKELSQKRPFMLLAVTVLTSFSQDTLPTNLGDISIEQHVENLAALVQHAGLRGLVCSPHEVQSLRSMYHGAYLVTPGIRFAEDAKGDQSRVMSPGEAMQLGASAIVVGRPILSSPDPIETVEKIMADIQSFRAREK